MFHFLLLILRFNTWIDPNSIDNKQDGRWDRKINFLPPEIYFFLSLCLNLIQYLFPDSMFSTTREDIMVELTNSMDGSDAQGSGIGQNHLGYAERSNSIKLENVGTRQTNSLSG